MFVQRWVLIWSDSFVQDFVQMFIGTAGLMEGPLDLAKMHMALSLFIVCFLLYALCLLHTKYLRSL